MRASHLLIATVLATCSLGVAAQSDPSGWQLDACRAVGVVVTEYPKAGSGRRGACVATAIHADGDFLVPRHCIEGALSANYKPLLVPGDTKSRKYPVTGIYDERIADTEKNGKMVRADVVRIHVEFGDDEVVPVPVADAIPVFGSAELDLFVRRGGKRGKTGDCAVKEVELISTFDSAPFEGRTLTIAAGTEAGASGSPVFDAGRLVGFVVAGRDSADPAAESIVAAIIDHPAIRRDGTLLTFAAYAEAHQGDALSALYRVQSDCGHDREFLARALELDSTLSSAWYRSAACAQQAGDEELTLEMFATAVEQEPKRRSLFELGLRNLMGDRDLEKGRAALLASLQIDPDFYDARITLAGSYAEKGETEAAKEQLSYILTRWPSVADAVLSDFEEYYPDLVSELRTTMSDGP